MCNSSSRQARRSYKVPKPSPESTECAGAIICYVCSDIQPRNGRNVIRMGSEQVRKLSKYRHISSFRQDKRSHKVPKAS